MAKNHKSKAYYQHRGMVPGVLDSKSPSHRHAHFLLCSIFILISSNTATLSSAQASNRSEDDRQALLCFKSGLSGNSAGVLGSWSNDSLNFCKWEGVTCSTAIPIRVASLKLRSVQLRGKLSSCVANLTSLVQMDLSNNSISGEIPDEIGSLPLLQTLILSKNLLSGTIPPEIGKLVSLTKLAMDQNMLSGIIPWTIGNLSNLVVLALSTNSLSGEIPARIGYLPQLIQLYLDDNTLSGRIPAQLVQCTRLAMLNLSVNSLNGSIPSEILSISSLSGVGLIKQQSYRNNTITDWKTDQSWLTECFQQQVIW